MKYGLRERLSACVLAVSALVLGGCPKPAPVPTPGGAQTIDQVLVNGSTDLRPNNENFYVVFKANTGLGRPVPRETCVDDGAWAFIRQLSGVKQFGGSIVTVTIPAANDSPAIRLPILSTMVAETEFTYDGKKWPRGCQTEFYDRPISNRYNPEQVSSFDLTFQFHYFRGADVSAAAKTMDALVAVSTAAVSAFNAPAGIAGKFASEPFQRAASAFDAALKDFWTSTGNVTGQKNISVQKPLTGGMPSDRIAFQMPGIAALPGGVSLTAWRPAGYVEVQYERPVFQDQDGIWLDRSSVLAKTVAPGTPTLQTDLNAILTNGTITGGATWATIKQATRIDLLQKQCNDLRNFLSKPFVRTDKAVALHAILRQSPYNDHPNLRQDSGCFEDGELGFLTTNNRTFTEQLREEPKPRDPDENKRMSNFSTALSTGNEALLRRRLIADLSKFELILPDGTDRSAAYMGADAMAPLVGLRTKLSCFQARDMNDLSTVGALITLNQKVYGVALTYDGDRVSNMTVQPVGDIVPLIVSKRQAWLKPDKDECNR